MKATLDNLKFTSFRAPGLDLIAIEGHPELGLLFIATHVMQKMGLKDAKRQVQRYKDRKGMFHVRDIMEVEIDQDPYGNGVVFETFLIQALGSRWKDAWLCTEPVLYQVLLQGDNPMSALFRGWVTEEVLPTLKGNGPESFFYEQPISSYSLDIKWERFRALLDGSANV
ncbi:hypothetical protein D3C85_1025690 [compost metagenome]